MLGYLGVAAMVLLCCRRLREASGEKVLLMENVQIKIILDA